MSDLARLGVVGLSAAYASGAATPSAALDAYVARIEKRNPALNAFLHLRIDAARAEAAAATKRWREGRPFSAVDGAPFGVKANIAVAGLPFHAGIGAYRENLAERDAPAVAALRNAGAIALGVVNMHEGALGATTDNPHFGRCHNPWKEGLTPGGSSGGSAAAVAARLCAFALGTDTMGSVRIPSAYCGIAGIKPTKNLISGDGLIDLSPTLDHVGLHASDVADLALAMRAFGIGQESETPARIGIARWGSTVAVEDEVAEAFRRASALLAQTAPCVDVDVSGFDFGALRRAGLLISEAEGHRAHREALQDKRYGFSNEFAGMLEWGARQSAEKVEEARASIRIAANRFAALFRQADVIVLPTAPQGPFAFGEAVPANQADLTCIANFGGMPAVATPAAGSGAPPPSIQFCAAPGRDMTALGAALAFEKARGPAPTPPD